MIFAGIDAGKKGCFCLLKIVENNPVITFFDYPKEEKTLLYFNNLKTVLSMNKVNSCFIEKVHSMPKQGVKSMFSFGENYGIWQGFLMGVGVSFETITPKQWQKFVLGKDKYEDVKEAVKDKALELFPSANLFGVKGAYKDGRGDSLMIAYTAYKLFVQQTGTYGMKAV